MGPISCPETSVIDYKSTARNIAEGRRYEMLWCCLSSSHDSFLPHPFQSFTHYRSWYLRELAQYWQTKASWNSKSSLTGTDGWAHGLSRHFSSYHHRRYPVHPSVLVVVCVVVVISEQRYKLSPSASGSYQRSQHQHKEVSQGRLSVSLVVQARGSVHKHVALESLASTGRINLKSGTCNYHISFCPAAPPPQKGISSALIRLLNTFCPALLSSGSDSLFVF